MNTRKYAKYASVAIAAATVASLALAIPASAATTSTNVPTTATAGATGSWQGQGGQRGAGGMGHGGMAGMTMKPAVFGTVTAVSGDTLTVSGHTGFGTSTPAVTYSVDATNAKITKLTPPTTPTTPATPSTTSTSGSGSGVTVSTPGGRPMMPAGTTITVSQIAIGDTVVVQGTITGTNVVATTIRDGIVPMRMGMGGMGAGKGTAPTSPITGNGEPVVAGKITAISGATLTITNTSNVVYTVDTTNAKIVQGQTTIAISALAVGNSVVVQGTVNGTAVTASSVIDQAAPASTTGAPKGPMGFFAGIGAFFSHIFGF